MYVLDKRKENIMSQTFKVYRRKAFIAIRQLLVCCPRETVNAYIEKAKKTKTENELSRVLAEVREII